MDLVCYGQFILTKRIDTFNLFKTNTCRHRQSFLVDKEKHGQCPVSRIRSTFIATSWRCCKNKKDRNSLIDAHKSSPKKIPHRTVLQNGPCRFASRCFLQSFVVHNSKNVFFNVSDLSFISSNSKQSTKHFFIELNAIY